jgi:predicted aminopeptidase
MSNPTGQNRSVRRRGWASDAALEIKPLAVKAKVARRLLGCGNTRFYELLGSGELQSYLDGRSRMVVLASIKERIARQVAEASAINSAATREIAAKSVASRRAKAAAAGRGAS